MNQNTSFSQFIGLYPVSKTLRFELKPIGKTLENVQNKGIIEQDEAKSLKYVEAKQIIDQYHKYFIGEALEGVNLDWNPLQKAFEDYLTNRNAPAKKNLEKTQESFRKEIAKKLSEHKHFKELTAATPKELFEKILPEHNGKQEAIEAFAKFSTYFKGFQENRENIYSSDAISTGVPFRIVHDNFPKFLSSIQVFQNIKENCPCVLDDAEKELQELLKSQKLIDVFNINYFNNVISQDGIDFFNQVIGGYTTPNGTKVRGMNEFANLYRQQNPEFAKKHIATKMIPLYKQILSDRESMSFVLESFNKDTDVQDGVKEFFEHHLLRCNMDGNEINVLEKIGELILGLKNYDSLNKFFVSRDSLSSISQKLFDNWNTLNNYLFNYWENKIGSVEKASNKKRIDAKLKEDYFSIEELNEVLKFNESDANICDFWTDYTSQANSVLSGEIKKNYEEFLAADYSNKALRENEADVQKLKDFLDAIVNILHLVKPLMMDSDQGEPSFYNELNPLYDQLSSIIPLYNKTRNYITQKISDSTKKFKLNFENPTLADGWDQNKEEANTSIILKKNEKFYLGIMNAKDKPKIGLYKVKPEEPHYDKMVYKLLPGPNKMLPKVFFSAKGKEIYKPSKEIQDGYAAGKHKKGDSFDKQFCHHLIDFFKEGISNHPDWKNFNFKFSETSSYEDISAFYNEVSDQGYKLSFFPIPDSQIDTWVNEGKLFLFQIYNKDFAPGAKGKPNLHTLYWKATFSLENLKDIVFKLNGEAELFYRRSSIKKPYSHKIGEKMVNRITKDGRPIPDAIFGELFRYFNNSSKTSLSDEAKKYLDFVTVKDVKHEIIKDKRYTEDKFEFHVPITINFKADDGSRYINDQVKDFLKNNSDVNIIGIDRGERNLIYMTLINQKGEILAQKSFNLVGNTNYHEKLSIREQERDAARRSWQSIGKIKELKEGYLSLVIHEIAKTMIENNAIIVLEDLNFGFKRGRFCVEKQVYQKFEKMLIDKLNYLVFKDCADSEYGGILKGYQLTQKFTSFKDIGKQNGFLFYVPAAYTSKIDPTTGFVNLFNFRDLTNAEKKKDFLTTLDDITFNSETNSFAFTFDYSKFKVFQTDYQKIWTVFTNGERIVYDRESKKHNIIEPTTIIQEALEKQGIQCVDQLNVLAEIEKIEPTRENARLFDSICYAFEKTLQMRNSNSETGDDYILSPVKNKNGVFFNSNEAGDKLPKDADANGAFHIALKGLFLLQHISETDEKLKIPHEKWFEFVQSRNK